MRARDVVVVVAVAAVVSTALRLGSWQLGRWQEKRSANAVARAALAAPPLDAGGLAPAADSLRGRRVRLAGHFDGNVNVLVRGREWQGESGVEWVTPFHLDGESLAVLVNRGWLPAADGATVPFESLPHERTSTVVAAPEPPVPPRAIVGLRRLESGPSTWSAAVVVVDSLRLQLGLALAPYVLRELPGEGSPALPRRRGPEFGNEAMHLGYAIQWFLIAALVAAGGVQLLRRRPRGPAAGGQPPDAGAVRR